MSPREKPAYDAAIISYDRDLCELITLLLDEAGYTSSVITEGAPNPARLMVIDLDSAVYALPAPILGRAVVGISSRADELPETARAACGGVILRRPFSFAKFRETVRQACEDAGKKSVTTIPMPGSRRLELDSASRRVSFDGAVAQLTPNEFLFFARLVERRGEAVSREELAALISGGEPPSGSNRIDVYICTLRKKLDRAFGQSFIRTARGKGYIIKGETGDTAGGTF